MTTRPGIQRIVPGAVIVVATVLLAAACSSDDGESTSTTTTEVAVEDPGRSADEITGPVDGGAGIYRPQPAVPVSEGYVEEEFFIDGQAVAYEAAGELPDDGAWSVAPGDADGEYRTRVIVRRPPEEDFSGTVIVEWLNVTAVEASPDWAYISEEVGREGHAYVSVSTQEQGIEGTDTLMDVTVDSAAAAETGAEGSADSSGLVNIDPERYATLTHPGDEYALDIFSQVGRALTEESELLLGGLEPEQVIGTGESQSAFYLTTYANAVHPLVGVYDGFMIHSRGAGSAPVDGQLDRDIDEADEADEAVVEQGVLIRTDLDVPVFIFEAETDLTLLGYANARQPDTELIRTWEVAGTAHADAHQFRALLGGPRDPTIASLIGCDDPINTGPHHETYQAAMNHLVAWAAGGPPPPEGSRLELEDGDAVVIARDDNGIALGGVRNPLVDVPTAALTGEPPAEATIETFDVCTVFGTTTSFDQAKLIELHGSADQYLEAFTASANEAVAAGFLLQADADELLAEAQENAALFN